MKSNTPGARGERQSETELTAAPGGGEALNLKQSKAVDKEMEKEHVKPTVLKIRSACRMMRAPCMTGRRGQEASILLGGPE